MLVAILFDVSCPDLKKDSSCCTFVFGHFLDCCVKRVKRPLVGGRGTGEEMEKQEEEERRLEGRKCDDDGDKDNDDEEEEEEEGDEQKDKKEKKITT